MSPRCKGGAFALKRSAVRRTKDEYATIHAVSLRACAVSFKDIRGVIHTAEVQAESLYEAVILGMRVFRGDPWIDVVGPATVFDVEVREPGTKHAISVQQIERWLGGATTSPNEASKKAKLKMLMMGR